MIRRAVVAAWILAVWLALWEDLSVGNVVGGALVGAFLVTVFPPDPRTEWIRIRPYHVARFVVYFLWKLVEASAIVAWEVVTPTNRINEGIVAVPVQGASDTLLTVVGNAITLTPGTLTVDVARDPPVLFVHVLHLRDVESVRRDVQHLELLAVRAFGSAECRRELERAVADGGGPR